MPEELIQCKLALSGFLAEVMERNPLNPTFKGNPACAPEEVARVVLERDRRSLAEGFPVKEDQWLVRWAVLVLFERQSLEQRTTSPSKVDKIPFAPTQEEIYRTLDVRPDEIKWLLDRSVPVDKIIDLFRVFVKAKLHFENSPDAPEFTRRLYEDPRATI
jgi:hypothetical protein